MSFVNYVPTNQSQGFTGEDILFLNILAQASDKAGFRLNFMHPSRVVFFRGTDFVWYLDYDFGFNNSVATRIARDKVICSSILNDLGIPTLMHYSVNSLFDLPEEKIVLKPQDGGGGSDVHICLTKNKSTIAYFKLLERYKFIAYSPFVEFTNEYRVSVLDGEVLISFGKTKGANGQNNLSFGAEVVPIPEGHIEEIHSLAIRATEALGLRIGNIDIIHDGTQFIVLEVNSSFMLKRVGYNELYLDKCIDVYAEVIRKRHSELY